MVFSFVGVLLINVMYVSLSLYFCWLPWLWWTLSLFPTLLQPSLLQQRRFHESNSFQREIFFLFFFFSFSKSYTCMNQDAEPLLFSFLPFPWWLAEKEPKPNLQKNKNPRDSFLFLLHRNKKRRSRTYIIRERRTRRRSEEKRTMIGALKE